MQGPHATGAACPGRAGGCGLAGGPASLGIVIAWTTAVSSRASSAKGEVAAGGPWSAAVVRVCRVPVSPSLDSLLHRGAFHKSRLSEQSRSGDPLPDDSRAINMITAGSGRALMERFRRAPRLQSRAFVPLRRTRPLPEVAPYGSRADWCASNCQRP